MRGQAPSPAPTFVSPVGAQQLLLVGPSGWSASDARDYPPRTTENSTGMVPFRCCTALSCAPDSLDRRRPPHLLGRGPVSHELSGVTHSRDSITVPKSTGFDAPRSTFHACMESSIGPSSHELQSLLFSVNHLRVAARVSSPFSHRFRFRVHPDHTIHEAGTSISCC